MVGAATWSVRWKTEPLSAAVPAPAGPALDEPVEPGITGEQLVEVEDVVQLKLPLSGRRWRLELRSGHSGYGLAAHMRAAGRQQVAGAHRNGPHCVASADRATERASPGCPRSRHMQGRFVGADHDLAAGGAVCSVDHGGPLLSDTSCHQDLAPIMDPGDCRDQGPMAPQRLN
jgi:hypothetical protein